MNVKFSHCSVLLALLGAVACQRTPVSPSAEGASGFLAGASALSARPAPPPTQWMSVALAGDVSASAQTMSGTVTGSMASGNLKISATASAYTLTVNEVRIQPNAPQFCTSAELDTLSEGLIGSPLTGAFSLSVDQANDVPNVTFALDNVATSDGKIWRIWSSSSFNYPATFDPDGQTAHQPFGKLTLSQQVKGNKGLGSACRATYDVTITPMAAP